jgi:hypothetical protein
VDGTAQKGLGEGGKSMKVQLIIDLSRILTSPARDAFEQYFGAIIPDDDKARKALGKGKKPLSQQDFDSMLAYLVKKTMFEDDGRGELFKVIA